MALNDITTRFLNTVSWLIKNKIVQDKKAFAQNVCISTSMMTEITKGRSNVGVIPLQNIVIKYGVSGDWLLTGEGSMIKEETQSASSESTENGVIAQLRTIIKEQSKEIARLELELEHFRSTDAATATP